MNVKLNTTPEGKIIFTKGELETFVKLVRDDAISDYAKELEAKKSLKFEPIGNKR